MICKILTPETSNIYNDVRVVSLPGTNGRFEVLPNHAELFQILIKGQIVVEKADGIRETKEISEGTCHFIGNTLTVIL